MIDWAKGTKEEYELASKIAKRAAKLVDRTVDNISMDIIATHTNGCKLKLQALLDADKFNFLHDVCGIATHLDRTTGKLRDCFFPRYAL